MDLANQRPCCKANLLHHRK